MGKNGKKWETFFWEIWKITGTFPIFYLGTQSQDPSQDITDLPYCHETLSQDPSHNNSVISHYHVTPVMIKVSTVRATLHQSR